MCAIYDCFFLTLAVSAVQTILDAEKVCRQITPSISHSYEDKFEIVQQSIRLGVGAISRALVVIGGVNGSTILRFVSSV
jgi:hypothetical protein